MNQFGQQDRDEADTVGYKQDNANQKQTKESGEFIVP